METVPGVQTQEMHRCKNRGFCCGAGGARMWMEERIGKRINTERIDEALGTDPDTISTGCPYCLVMLGDAVAAKKWSAGSADRARSGPGPGSGTSCATRRRITGRRWKGSAAGLSQQAGQAESSLIRETPGRAGAALTTRGRAGTARRPGPT
jgi:hypothetical protein